MSRTFTFVTLGLTATMAFMLGVVAASLLSPASPVSLPQTVAPPTVRYTVMQAWTPGGLVNFADVAERINPAVVNIEATTARTSGSEGRRRFDRDVPDGGSGSQPQSRRPQSGSGFVIEKNGVILTNYHVVQGAER